MHTLPRVTACDGRVLLAARSQSRRPRDALQALLLRHAAHAATGAHQKAFEDRALT
jgi:hypothetical protein